MKRAEKLRIQRRNRIIIAGVFLAALTAVAAFIISRSSVPVLQPAGTIAAGQKQLLITAFLLMLIIVVPVFVLLFTIAWRYREGNKKATYRPDWDHNRGLEAVWWLVPTGLIMVLALITWRGTHQYDPYKPIAVKQDTMVVQVVALDWRWLFIYPELKIASLNELRMPVDQAIQFDITADAPMNSFWIPQLGGQMYAMPGMGTRLHLVATEPGEFYGSSANISGEGFSKMNFLAKATSRADFEAWVRTADKQPPLTESTYEKLAQKSTDKTVRTFSDPANDLYGTIISKYMHMEPHDHRKDAN